jgi:hypothetical protein
LGTSELNRRLSTPHSSHRKLSLPNFLNYFSRQKDETLSSLSLLNSPPPSLIIRRRPDRKTNFFVPRILINQSFKCSGRYSCTVYCNFHALIKTTRE